jgi:hypothetical protein
MTPHCHWFPSYFPHIISICIADGFIIHSADIGLVVFQPKESIAQPKEYFDVKTANIKKNTELDISCNYMVVEGLDQIVVPTNV